MRVFLDGNKVFWVQGTLRKPSGTISSHFEGIWKNRKKSWIFKFFRLKVKEFLYCWKTWKSNFFSISSNPSKCEEMVPDGFRSVPWTQNILFPSRNTLTIYQKKISKPILGPWEADFWNSNFHQFKAAGLMKKWTDLNFIAL